MTEIEKLFDLSNKPAIVTGASKGIGAGVARLLAKAGSDIAIIYHKDRDGAESVKNEILGLGKTAVTYQADVANSKAIAETFREIHDEFKRIDILINNSGVYPHSNPVSMPEEEWDNVIDVNLKGAFTCSREAVKYMIEGKSGGKIVNISSIAALQPERDFSHYCASKGGLISLTKALALEWSSFGIYVNSVAPGLIDTGSLEENVPERLHAYIKLCPLKRAGTPEDIARAVLFLASGASDYITGQTLFVDGGVLLGGYMELT